MLRNNWASRSFSSRIFCSCLFQTDGSLLSFARSAAVVGGGKARLSATANRGGGDNRFGGLAASAASAFCTSSTDHPCPYRKWSLPLPSMCGSAFLKTIFSGVVHGDSLPETLDHKPSGP